MTSAGNEKYKIIYFAVYLGFGQNINFMALTFWCEAILGKKKQK